MKRMENIEGEYNFQFQEFLPIPSSSMDKLSIKERIIIEVCDFLETWCWFLFAFGLDRSSIQGDFLYLKIMKNILTETLRDVITQGFCLQRKQKPCVMLI